MRHVEAFEPSCSITERAAIVLDALLRNPDFTSVGDSDRLAIRISAGRSDQESFFPLTGSAWYKVCLGKRTGSQRRQVQDGKNKETDKLKNAFC